MSKPHSELVEEIRLGISHAYTLELFDRLVEQVEEARVWKVTAEANGADYRRLKEQLETARVWEHTAKANGDDYQRLKEQLETLREALEEIRDNAYVDGRYHKIATTALASVSSPASEPKA